MRLLLKATVVAHMPSYTNPKRIANEPKRVARLPARTCW